MHCDLRLFLGKEYFQFIHPFLSSNGKVPRGHGEYVPVIWTGFLSIHVKAKIRPFMLYVTSPLLSDFMTALSNMNSGKRTWPDNSVSQLRML